MTDFDEQNLSPGAQVNTATHLNEIRTPTVRRKEGIRTRQETKWRATETSPANLL